MAPSLCMRSDKPDAQWVHSFHSTQCSDAGFLNENPIFTQSPVTAAYRTPLPVHQTGSVNCGLTSWSLCGCQWYWNQIIRKSGVFLTRYRQGSWSPKTTSTTETLHSCSSWRNWWTKEVNITECPMSLDHFHSIITTVCPGSSDPPEKILNLFASENENYTIS